MDKFNSIFLKIKQRDHDDDFVDRINYSITATFLSFFAALILAKQAVGEPLQCWVPAEYKDPWEKYIEAYCFVENTYYVNSTLEQFPAYQSERRNYELKYYQWMPYIFLLEAIICYSPKMLFKILYSFSDLRVTDILQYAWQKTRGNKAELKPTDEITKDIAQRLLFVGPKHETPVVFVSYLTRIYFFMKIFTIITIVCQLCLLAFFIDAKNIFWGFGLIQDFLNGHDWRTNGYFPRVTFCDLHTRDLGQQRPHTIQCVLMLNMFIEKIYIFLWAWFLLMFVLSVINLIYWSANIFSSGRSESMVNNALLQSGLRQVDYIDIKDFIKNHLHHDGIVILRLIDSNVGYIAMSDVCRQLWNNFMDKNK